MAIIKNEIPILEFDTEQTAVLNPTHENLGLNLPKKCERHSGLTPLVGLLVVGLSIRQSPSASCQLEQLMGREAVRLAGDPDETGLFQRRQVARREEVRAPDPECRAQFGGMLRAVGQLTEDVGRDALVAATEDARHTVGHPRLELANGPRVRLFAPLLVHRKAGPRLSRSPFVLKLADREGDRLLVARPDLGPFERRERVDEAITVHAAGIASAGGRETAPGVVLRAGDELRLDGVAVDVGGDGHQRDLLVRRILPYAEA